MSSQDPLGSSSMLIRGLGPGRSVDSRAHRRKGKACVEDEIRRQLVSGFDVKSRDTHTLLGHHDKLGRGLLPLLVVGVPLCE
ncbi:unnamed protein product [Pleuronectes platessa]|uniref:Uncharacterized protein n=1 Tax=Pleuronectes platessa TaxID=8262 RepID=A0A9N7YBG6_PLEPL|nr:unnamed protein product [Pleuronectes platessa]